MATIPVSVDENLGAGEDGGKGQFVRVIVADTQAIFRAGCARCSRWKMTFAWWGRRRRLAQTQSAAAKFCADVMIFEGGADAESGGRRGRSAAPESESASGGGDAGRRDEELTLELFRRGASRHCFAGSRA